MLLWLETFGVTSLSFSPSVLSEMVEVEQVDPVERVWVVDGAMSKEVAVTGTDLDGSVSPGWRLVSIDAY